MPDSTAGQPPAQPSSNPSPPTLEQRLNNLDKEMCGVLTQISSLRTAVADLASTVLGADHPTTVAVSPPKPVEPPPVSSPGTAGTSSSPPPPG